MSDGKPSLFTFDGAIGLARSAYQDEKYALTKEYLIAASLQTSDSVLHEIIRELRRHADRKLQESKGREVRRG